MTRGRRHKPKGSHSIKFASEKTRLKKHTLSRLLKVCFNLFCLCDNFLGTADCDINVFAEIFLADFFIKPCFFQGF